MKKRLLSLVLCLVMVFSLFPTAVLASDSASNVNLSGSAAGLQASWSKTSSFGTVDATASENSITASADGYTTVVVKNQAEITITLKNMTYKTATLVLDYDVTTSGDGFVKINGVNVTGIGTSNVIPLNMNNSIDIVVKSPKGNGTKTSASFTNITLTDTTPAASFSVASDSASVNVGDSTTVNVTDIVGCSISATSNDSSIAEASYANGQVTITGKAAGTTTVTVTGTADSDHSAPNPASYTINVTVTDGSGPVNPPTPASTTYADNGANDAQAGSKSVSVIDRDDMYMSKTLTRENDGTYTIELNAYAKGEKVTQTSSNPSDVILVLDLSGSMNAKLDGQDQLRWVKMDDMYEQSNKETGLTPYTYADGSDYFYPVYIKPKAGVTPSNSAEDGGYDCWYVKTDGTHVRPNILQNMGYISSNPEDNGVWFASVYYNRWSALKYGVDRFLTGVAKGGGDTRVAIVGFSDTSRTSLFGKTGEYTHATVSGNHGSYDYYTEAMWSCKDDIASLRKIVNDLKVGAANNLSEKTRPEKGFDVANWILEDQPSSGQDADRKTSVILFTDGEPDNLDAANGAIGTAEGLKSGEGTVYSLGIFDNNNDGIKITGDYTVGQFMNYVSNNYPEAEDMDTPHSQTSNKYYHLATSAAELATQFETISSDVAVPAVQLGTDAILRDVIDTDNFNLANAEVEAKWQLAGTPNWNTANKINSVDDDNLNKETGVLEVTGFNYSEYYIGAGNQWGRQIIVRITGLTLNKENPTYIDPVEVGGVTDAIASNESAGVYKNAEAVTNNSPVISPLIPWTRYTPPEPDPVDSNASDDGGDLKMTKGLYMDPTTGEYSIRMDAWSTGVVKQTDVDLSVPTDIILVIDLSDSMYLKQDVVVGRNEDGTPIMGYRKDALLNALDKFILKLQTEQSKHADNPNYYRLAVVTFAGYYDHHDPTVASSGAQGGTYVFYPTNYDSNSTTNTYLASDKKDQKATVTTQIANAALRPINDACVTAFDSMIHSTDNKQPFGFWRFNGTKPDRGLEYAYDILDKRTDKSKSAAVILFTDGAPGTSSGLQHDGTSDGDGYVNYADDAIKKAHDIKALGAAHDNNIKIFTVGLLSTDPSYKLWVQGNNNRNSEYRIDRAMEFISSDYPDITNIYQYGSDEAEQETHRNTDGVEYYTRVGTGSDNVSTALETALGAAMTTVVSGYSGATVGFDDKLTDTIDLSNFDLPDDFSEEANVEVYAVPALGFNTDGSIIWDNSNKVKVGDDPIVKGSDTVIDFNGEDAVTVTGNKVEVSGFDYSKLYTAQGSGDPILGYKLVVKINGLLPKHGGNDIQSNADTETAFAAGVYSEDGTPAVTVKSPVIDIDSQPYVIDFNVKMNLTSVGENAKIVNFANRERVNSLSGTNGDFSIASNNLYYQLKYNNDGTSLTSGNAAGLVMASSDSAMIYDGAAWKEHIAIPASSVYFDDDLLEAKTVDVGDGSGRNAGVSNGSADPLTAGEYTFKFNGSAIDIYGTTNADGGYIVGTLCSVNPDGSIGDRVTEVKNEMMKVHSVTPRNNVPVISIDAPSYNTYYLKLKVVATSNFSLDGIRVYGSVNDQTTYDKTTEKYAAYINLRKALLNDSYAAVDGSSTVDITTGAVAPGALFVDDVSKLTVQVPDLDKDGKEQHDEAGNVIMKDAWQTPVKKYAANSPKNEVYLAYENQPYSTGEVDENGKPVMSQYASNQSLVFTLTDTALQGKIWIGLSAPDADSMSEESTGEEPTGAKKTRQVTVTVNGEDHTIPVDNQLDQYYELKKDWLGTGSGSKVVTITNSGNTMISVTNLKITGVQSIYNAANDITSAYDDNGDPAAIVESFEDVMDLVFEPVTVHTLRVAQNKGVDPDAVIVPAEPDTPDEPDTPVVPGIREMLRELISSFVSSLFTSIGRLFGH